MQLSGPPQINGTLLPFASGESPMEVTWEDELEYVTMQDGRKEPAGTPRKRGRLRFGWAALSYRRAAEILVQLDAGGPVVVRPRTRAPGDFEWVEEVALPCRVVGELPSTAELRTGHFPVEAELETLRTYPAIPAGLQGAPAEWGPPDVIEVEPGENAPPAVAGLDGGFIFTGGARPNSAPAVGGLSEGFSFVRPETEPPSQPPRIQGLTPLRMQAAGFPTDLTITARHPGSARITSLQITAPFSTFPPALHQAQVEGAGGTLQWVLDPAYSHDDALKRRLRIQAVAPVGMVGTQPLVICRAEDQHGNVAERSFRVRIDPPDDDRILVPVEDEDEPDLS